MRKAIPAWTAAAAVALLGATASDGRLAPGNGSALNLFVEKTGVLSGKKHHFTFEQFEGQIDGAQRRVVLTIQSAGIVCRDNWVSEKDRGKILKVATDDMLAVAKYPVIRFESTNVSGDDRLTVEGNLTIRDKTRPVTVHVQRKDKSYTGEARFKLTDFGLKPPSAALGLVGTKDEMTLQFTVAAQ